MGRLLSWCGAVAAAGLVGAALGALPQVWKNSASAAYFPGATCAAHQWITGVTLGSGAASAISCAQPAAGDLSDTTAPTAWTPSDASGASLSLTNNGSYYYQIGKQCIVVADVSYPTTSDGSSAKLGGMPCTPTSHMNNASTIFFGFNSVSINPFYGYAAANSPQIRFVSNASASAVTNAALSGAEVRIQVIFFTN